MLRELKEPTELFFCYFIVQVAQITIGLYPILLPKLTLTNGKLSAILVLQVKVSATAESRFDLRKKGGADLKKNKKKYDKSLPRQMYTFFISFSESEPPSFLKFARSIGATVEDIESFRRHGEFERAYKECNEIRRDYLIDRALTKRYDPSLVKFLLADEFGAGEDAPDDNINVKITVTD